MRERAVFLDRDGVLNYDKVDYVYTIEEFKIFDGVKEALAALKKENFKLIIITNQSGIAKGIYQEKDVWNCYHYLQSQTGNLIDDMFFCPHHPQFDKVCSCRKPGYQMILDASLKHNINLAESFMVGDAQRDVTAGQGAGLRTVHIDNGKETAIGAHHTAANLLEAAKWILHLHQNSFVC